MRRLRFAAAIASSLCLTGALRAQTSPITTGTLQANMFRIATIPTATQGEPIDLVTAPGDVGNRLFVATHHGDIRLVKNNSLQTTPFLDLAARGVTILGGSGSDERGLLGIAFHPNFYAPAGTPGSGKFYTFTAEPKVGNADFYHPEIGATGGDNQSVIREWTVNPSSPDVADATVASRVLMRMAHPQSNHNGGALRFGNDGMLYISLGDGGGGDDYSGSVTSTTDGHTSPNGNGQDLTNVQGKILRINPTGTNSANGKYGVPADNPFYGSLTAVNEIFAYGLRNPFRINFDRPTGKLYVGDVGQNVREEVDIVTSGGNYGWAFMEGTRVNTISGRTIPQGFTSIAPIAEYTHNDGHSITGGYVYHGSVPEWQGKYIFGDYNGISGSAGRLFYMDQNGGTIFQFNNTLSGGTLYAFGEDADGELYAMMSTGAVDKLLAPNAWNVDGGGSWGLAADWNGPVPGVGGQARFLNRLTRTNGPATITLDGDRDVSSVTISNPNRYIISQGSGGALTFDALSVNRGSHLITAPVRMRTNTGGVVITVSESSDVELAGPFIPIGNLIRKRGAGLLRISGQISASPNNILQVEEGVLDLVSNMGKPASPTGAAGTYISLITGTGTANSKVILNGDQDLSQVSVGYKSAGSQGLDLNSPSAPGAFRSVRVYGIGFGLAGEYSGLANALSYALTHPGDGIYDSKIAASSSMRIGIHQGPDLFGTDHLEMRPTVVGDLNLDGVVSISDFLDLAAHLNAANPWWQDGDMNYDGSVTIADFIELAANFGTSYAGEVFPIDPAEAAQLQVFYQANVPEPAGLFPVLIGSIILFNRFARRPLWRAA